MAGLASAGMLTAVAAMPYARKMHALPPFLDTNDGRRLMSACITAIRGAAALMLLVMLGTACADEEKVPLDKLPKAVLDAVKAKFPGAELLSRREGEGRRQGRLRGRHQDQGPDRSR